MGTSAKRGLMGRRKAKQVVPCAPAPASYIYIFYIYMRVEAHTQDTYNPLSKHDNG